MSLMEVRGLSKSFGGVRATHDVTFDVQEGEILGIIGPNGAGKSTLLELISGFQSPDAGSVNFEGNELTGQPAYKINQLGIARTFQKLRPFLRMTTLDNVMVAALVRDQSIERAREKALRCIDFVGIPHKTTALADTLSTGQRKRLEFARAIASDPVVLLLDEVMAGVDQKSLADLIALVRRLRDLGTTIVMIEHNLDVLRALCDRIMALHLGELVVLGSPDEVLNHPQVVNSYMGE